MSDSIRFFLGSNTRNGFIPYFDQLWMPRQGERLFILKGGPGCGKSTLMKKIGSRYEQRGMHVEYIPCASDPNSLDAVWVADRHFAMVDGTPPHVMEPAYPGAYETLIPMGDAWDEAMLGVHLGEIMDLNRRIGACHKSATDCIRAAASLLDCVNATAAAYIQTDRAEEFISVLSELIRHAPKGKVHKRLLSAVSVGRLEFFEDTLHVLCNKIYALEDPFGAASHMILNRIAKIAEDAGISCIVCPCSVMGSDAVDHILFPEIGLGLTAANAFHAIRDTDSVIRVTDLQTCSPQAADWPPLHNAMETAKGLIGTACAHVQTAKALHDELEQFYIAAMDFEKIDRTQKQILEQVESMA